jgi:hypothetical protein
MRKTGEWGQFFSRELSPFCYNETIAHEYFPMTEKQVKENGWRWKKEARDEEKSYLGPSVAIPEDIKDVDDSICSAILRCEATGKLFEIIPQELKFYKTMNLPLPRKCFMQRQAERFALRNPRKLWQRKCQKCQKEIQTTYAPERPEIVYCERCYLETVY